MTLGVRKAVVAGLAVIIFLMASAQMLANWLDQMGVIRWASFVRREFLTGTAIAVILALLILLAPSGRVVVGSSALIRRCPVCDHVLLRKGRYCPECGSRV